MHNYYKFKLHQSLNLIKQVPISNSLGCLHLELDSYNFDILPNLEICYVSCIDQTLQYTRQWNLASYSHLNHRLCIFGIIAYSHSFKFHRSSELNVTCMIYTDSYNLDSHDGGKVLKLHLPKTVALITGMLPKGSVNSTEELRQAQIQQRQS